MKGLRPIYIALLLVLAIVIAGIIGYTILEGYSVADAFYMTIITVATVGFSEVHPLSDGGKMFTAILIIISFSTFGYVASLITRFFIDGAFKNYYRHTKVKKKIEQLSDHIIVCGFGRNGEQTVFELLEHNRKVVVIEKVPAVIDMVRKIPDLLYIEGDSTSEDVLIETRISHAKALVTTLPNDADNLYVVLTARELNPGMTIISRATDENSVKKLKRAGANNVIMPDRIGGQRMAKLVVQPDIVEFIEFIMLQRSKDVYLEELSLDHSLYANRSIRELDIRNASGANIVGIRTKDRSFVVNPSPDLILSPLDKLFVLGNRSQLEKLSDILIDNNNSQSNPAE
jgi:voltage-gated potassium channel